MVTNPYRHGLPDQTAYRVTKIVRFIPAVLSISQHDTGRWRLVVICMGLLPGTSSRSFMMAPPPYA